MKGAAITASSLYFSRGAGTNRAGKLQRKEGGILSRCIINLSLPLLSHYYLLFSKCPSLSLVSPRAHPCRAHLIDNLISEYLEQNSQLGNIGNETRSRW